MKRMKLIISCTLLLLSGCSNKEMIESVKEDFSIFYEEKNNNILEFDETSVYYGGKALNLNELGKKEYWNMDYIIHKNYFYFTTTKRIGYHNYTLNVYKSYYNFESTELIFSKDNLLENPRTYGINDMFYIEIRHILLPEVNIDRYDIKNNIYENIEAGKNKDINIDKYIVNESNDYENEFRVKINNYSNSTNKGNFEIDDLSNGGSITIDEDYLKNTIFYDFLEKYHFRTRKFYIVENAILLTFTVYTSNRLFRSEIQPYVIFEYDYQNDKLEYKTLSFASDNSPYHKIIIK